MINGEGNTNAQETNIKMKRWDRYSASFTTNEEKKEDDIKGGHRRRVQNITTVKA